MIPNPTAGTALPSNVAARATSPMVILSFDVEEHHRIEAAAHLDIPTELKEEYTRRVGPATRWILETLAERDILATFFIVGEFAQCDPALVREIQAAGHEVASHGWDHKSVLKMTPAEFREDVRRSKDTLEQITGAPVVGYRAPTFSIVRRTLWAIDELAELGFLYDSSIYPVRHDRYGIPDAPRGPHLARGNFHFLLEFPPATLRAFNTLIPTGGGGYFRLFPLAMVHHALQQMRDLRPSFRMLYFHPWEFDFPQPRLPLKSLSRLRTYVGLDSTRKRLKQLMSRHTYTRGVDAVPMASRELKGVLGLTRRWPDLDRKGKIQE